MAPTTPGLLYVVRGLVNLLLPVAGVYGGLHVLSDALDLPISPLTKWIAAICTSPALAVANGVWARYREAREAKAMGATPVPVLNGKWIGNFDILLAFKKSFEVGYPAEPFWDVFYKLGPTINIRIFGQNQIFTSEPEHIKQILATEFNNFEKGAPFIEASKSVLGTGVFNSDADMWKFHRAMTRPFFSKDRISHFDIFERHADEAIAAIQKRLRDGYAVDFQDLVSRFTLDSATEFLFGNCVHSLRAGLPYPENVLHANPALAHRANAAEEFAQAFAEAQLELAMRLRVGKTWPMWEVFRDKTKKPMKIVDTFLNPILSEALRKKHELQASEKLEEKERGKDDIEDDETLLDHLVKMTDDKTILKDEILNIMIAGRDTTAGTLTFAIYFMALHPEVTQRLRAEVLDKVGATQRPTYDNIRDMKYLRAFINETLRLYPAVPFNVRYAINATTLSPCKPGAKPFYVPAQTNVSYSVFMMHRRTDLWGPDAMEFDPDRFLDERLQKYLTPNPFIFLPFNAGPRICLGQQFAYNEASFMIIRLLQNFDSFELDMSAQPADSQPPPEWKSVPGRQSIERLFPKCHLTMYAHKGLWVRMGEANN